MTEQLLMNPTSSALYLREEEVARGMDFLFFAHNHFWRSIDTLLAEENIGRAHFRTLYCINRQPGLTMSALLSLLGVSKQSLGRVLKELKGRQLVATRPGHYDRREKQLHLTEAGSTLEVHISTVLREEMSRSYSEAGQAAVTGYWRVCGALIPQSERARIMALGKIQALPVHYSPEYRAG